MFFTTYLNHEIVSKDYTVFSIKRPDGTLISAEYASVQEAKNAIDELMVDACRVSVKIPFSGFYGSTHDALFTNWLEYEQNTLMTEHGCTLEQVEEFAELSHTEINWKAVHTAYARAYVKEVEKLINDEGRVYKEDSTGKRYLSAGLELSIEFEALESPVYYNYGTDEIHAKIPLFQLKALRDIVETQYYAEWSDLCEEKFTSRDGFISFYSFNPGTWPDDLREWGEARLGVLLECYIMSILKDGSNVTEINEALSAHNLCSDLDGNGHISNWIWEHAGEKFTTYADSLRKE